MKRGLMRKLAFGIIAAMVISILPFQYTMAIGVGETVDEQIEETSEISEETEAVEDEVVLEDDNEEIDESLDAENVAEKQIQDRPEQKLNYIYVEKPYLETPDEQNIIISWGDGSDEVTDMKLVYQKENSDELQEIIGSLNIDELFLFKMGFSEESDMGIYNIISIKMTVNGVEVEYTLDELETEAVFGVNREYDGYKEHSVQACTEEGEVLKMPEESSVEISTVSLDEDGNISGEKSIETALEEAEPDMEKEGVTALLALDGNSTSRAGGRSDELVVAIDAGHDNIDAGAYYNGLREEVLTLKIAEYCKAELEKYAGVRVYMTRTGAGCPVGVTSYPHAGTCIDRRVKKAAEAGADVVVSIHLNASVAASAQGAEVIVPNQNWKPEQNKEGTELAQQILNQLTALGLYNRGFYWKNTTINEKYPDGSSADYFTIHNSGKEYGVTSLIVEHAFISNIGGVDQSLVSSESGLKKLGVADATGIAQYYGLVKLGDKVSIPEGTYILESVLKPGSAITIDGGSKENQTAAKLNTYRNQSAQRFEIHSNGNGYYKITAEHSDKVLDIKNAWTNPGTQVQQYESNGSAAQSWAFLYAGDDSYYIASALGTFLDLSGANTSEGTPITSYSYNGTEAQKWRLVKSDYRPIANGTYTFANMGSPDRVLDVSSASTENGASVSTYTNNDTSAQRFEVYYVDGGYYRIVAEHSGKSLDVPEGNGNVGTQVQQWDSNSNDAQLWKFVETGTGAYYLKSKLGTVIGLDDSAGITMQKMDSKGGFQWILQTSNYQPVKDGEYVISSKKVSIQVMTEKNGNIQLETFDNFAGQRFKVEYQGQGYYRILLRNTGESLDVESGRTTVCANVQTYSWNGTDAQLWKFVPDSSGSYYIKSKLGTVLDLPSGNVSSGTNIQTYSMNYTDAQKWILDTGKVSGNGQLFEDGVYMIRNLTGENQVLDVAAALLGDFANIHVYSNNGTAAQRYELIHVKDGYYRITAEHSGKVLDVAGASGMKGANVQQYTWNGTDAQLWKFIPYGDGSYCIQSKLGTVLDVNNSVASSGSNVEMNVISNRKTQRWNIEKTKVNVIEDGLYVLKNSSFNQYVLDIESASTADLANTQISTYNGSDAQKFQITHIKDGYYSIVAKHSGKALEYKNTVSIHGANVYQNKWSGVDNQLWKFIKKDDNMYYIRSKDGTVLDVNAGIFCNGSNVQMYECNGTAAQWWNPVRIEDVKGAEIKEGAYIIHSVMGENNVLDISAASRADFANVQIYTNNNTMAQRFLIEKVEGDYYKIICANSDKVLDISAGSPFAGANVQQYTWNGTAAQLWKFVDAGDGQHYIQSKLGTVLDVQWGGTEPGTNVQTYDWNKTNSQKWVLEKKDRALYRIMGDSNVTIGQMVKYYEAQSRDGKPLKYPYTEKDGAANITEFCQIYLEEAKAEGVKAEVAFAQAMKETGFLKFGGDVKKEQYNFAGLGATGNGEPGLKFKDIRTGIRAQIQHLKAYASTEPLNQECVDPRFKYVKRGSAEYVEWLGQRENPVPGNGWATGVNYGYSIVDDYIKPMMEY